jgi:excinuclease ABC subunit C
VLSCSLQFDAAHPEWTKVPAAAGIFALFGSDQRAQPYLSRSPNLRNRLRRLLEPREKESPLSSKRLRLAESVVRIEYTLIGSELEAWLRLYDASFAAFGESARQRLHLRPPVLLRIAMENAYPRVYVTNRVTNRAANDLFGPWSSRGSAESFLEEMLNLFELRRCTEELHPDPAFPGCVYSEMKKCMAPCFKGCTDERYAQEAATVHAFLATRGQSLITDLSRERERASAELDFEKAAETHARLARVEAAVAGVLPVVRPLAQLNGVIVQPASEPEQVALFLLHKGCLTGPVAYSVSGMRLHNEHSGSSSLFAQPMAIEAVPLDESGAAAVRLASRDQLTARLEAAMALLRTQASSCSGAGQRTADHLCLFSRWYYRPPAKRVGEICFAESGDEAAPKALLRAISRVYSKSVSVAAEA